jgi:Concanavalin A-like lectin/glucanases superfamily
MKIPQISQWLALIGLLVLPRMALAQFDPNNPSAYGYQLSFDSTFQASKVDTGNTGAAGYDWYTRKPFWYNTETDATFAFGSNGVTITPTVNTGSYHLASAYPSGTGYVGNVFGPGWYVEAQVSFDPTLVIVANSWPAFWALQWPGMTNPPQDYWPEAGTNYRHNVEDDLFEFNQQTNSKYGSTLHDWYGTTNPLAKVTPPLMPGNISLSADPDWKNFHRIGQLWIKGTAANGYVSTVTNYFDGVPYTTYSSVWQDQANASHPPSGTYAFARKDDMPYVLILGSGVGPGNPGSNPQPLNVKSVQVWKLPDQDIMDLRFEKSSIDYSGFANNGTLVGSGITYLTGGEQYAGDYCISLDGSGYINVPNSPSINTLTSELALDVYVYPTSTTGYRRIVNTMSDGGTDAYYLDLKPSTNQIRFNVRGYQITTTSFVPTNTWTHIRATSVQNGTMGVWINGILDTAAAAPNVAAMGKPLPFHIGADNGGASNWIGRIDELRVSANVNAPAVSFLFENNLNDNSGSGNNGTIEGSGTTYLTGGQQQSGNYSINFNGSGYVNVTDTASIDAISNELAVDVWVYPTNASGYRRIVDKMTPGGGDGFYLDLVPTTNQIRFNVRSNQITTTRQVPLNTWTHIRATFVQNGLIAVYINGAEDTTVTAPNVPAIGNALPLRIAGDQNGGSRWVGRIDNLVISPNMD